MNARTILALIAGFALGVFVWGRYVHETSKEDYIRVTMEGIQIGYRCQRTGLNFEQCMSDYRRFIGAGHE